MSLFSLINDRNVSDVAQLSNLNAKDTCELALFMVRSWALKTTEGNSACRWGVEREQWKAWHAELAEHIPPEERAAFWETLQPQIARANRGLVQSPLLQEMAAHVSAEEIEAFQEMVEPAQRYLSSIADGTSADPADIAQINAASADPCYQAFPQWGEGFWQQDTSGRSFIAPEVAHVVTNTGGHSPLFCAAARRLLDALALAASVDGFERVRRCPVCSNVYLANVSQHQEICSNRCHARQSMRRRRQYRSRSEVDSNNSAGVD